MMPNGPARPEWHCARVMPAPPFVTARLAALRSADLFRDPPTVDTADGIVGTVGGRGALLLCSNDYLGLRHDPRVKAAAARAAERYGAGAGSSRLIAGSLPIHAALEDELADWMGTEAALLFSSGYQANLALLGALPARGDLVVSDGLNHASLIDGCRLSYAEVVRVPHGDVEAARGALGSAEEPGERFLLGEGLYSMDGDRGPVAGWAAASRAHGAHLLVDEAHAVGVLGPEGRGVCAEAGVPARGSDGGPLVRVGTFGKAFGAHGAFVATDGATRDLLVNAGRAYVFSTGVPPAAAGAAREALRIVRSDEGAERRATVLARARQLAHGAAELGLPLAGFAVERPSPIVPIVLGAAARALEVAARLLDAGIYAKAIRPPTVPDGTSRIRFTVSANHTAAHVDSALAALRAAIALHPRP
jgi:8-amino-7-oxononanoate synthase